MRERVAIGVSHNDQKVMVRGLLERAGLSGVVVDTANKLQGLEFDVSVCWHPMAGLDETDEFHLEFGPHLRDVYTASARMHRRRSRQRPGTGRRSAAFDPGVARH